jgi:vitamin K-dependent gamma-carboxylase
MRARRKPTASWLAAATRPVDASSLAVVRIALGLVGLLSVGRIVAYGWTGSLYAGPSHRFSYLGFAWVPQPSVLQMRGLLVVLTLASLGLALGWRTRLSALGFLLAFTWIELIDATTYLNHYWFLTLVGALAVVAPLGRALSLDARRAGGPSTVATGWVWLLRFQVGVVYAFAGLAKLQPDWLVHALPLDLWLPARADVPVLGRLVGIDAVPHLLAVAGALFDCLVVPLLLWRRTRLAAWIVLVAFHVCTWALFPIGVFPWLMVGAATVFFEPDWPRRRLARFGRGVAVPRVRTVRRSPVLAALAIAWVVVQLALPLRHLAYAGDHRWTGQGYRFAWNVLLVEKSGTVTFLVHEPSTGRTWVADPRELYTRNQLRVMATEPDLIHQAALAIAADEGRRGHDVEVRVDAWVSLNARPAARLIDPTVDLAAEPRDPWSDDWILPAPT